MKKYIHKIIINVIAIVTALACCNACSGGIAIAATIEEYGQQITENTSQIEQLEIIKEQLHITAELLRANDYINNGFGEQLSQKWHECTEWQESKRLENIELKTLINDLREAQTKEYVGGFKITHYCPCLICNGNYGNQTALGTPLTPYKTIAVDPKVIPLGSKVEINGNIYIAEDTGGAIKGNRIDVCVSTHSEANARGVLYNVPVYIVK